MSTLWNTLLSSLSAAFLLCYFTGRIVPFSARFKHPFLCCFSALTITITITIFSLGVGFSSLRAFVVQVLLLLAILFFFQASLMQKLALYAIFLIIETCAESLIVTFFIWLLNRISGTAVYTTSNLVSAVSEPFLLVILGGNALLGLLFCHATSELLSQCFSYLNAAIFFQLAMPVVCPITATIFVTLGLKISGLFFFGYFLLCFASFFVFFHGVRALKEKQYRYSKKIEEMQLLQERLNSVQNLNTQYTQLRKWNHDVKNHLISMSYLMEAGDSPQMQQYLKEVLKQEAGHEA